MHYEYEVLFLFGPHPLFISANAKHAEVYVVNFTHTPIIRAEIYTVVVINEVVMMMMMMVMVMMVMVIVLINNDDGGSYGGGNDDD